MTVPDRVVPGQPITADLWNNLSEAAFGLNGPNRRSRRSFFFGKNDAGADMLPASVGVISSTALTSDPTLLVDLQRGGDGVVVANGLNAIPNGQSGPIFVVDFAPIQVRSTGAIAPGDSCGPATGSWEVSTSGSGLVAVSAATDNKVWVIGESGGGGGASTIALAPEVIPGRSGTTPGGPITCKVISDDSGTLTEGDDVEVYSWVGSDSPDPTGDWSGYIYISQSANDGLWWMHAIDCVPPPPAYAVLSTGSTIPTDGTEVIYVT